VTAVVTPVMANPLGAVDSIRVQADGELTAVKEIDAGDPYLSGHYPGGPIYPGVFVIESVLQASRRYLGEPTLSLAEVESARFQAPLLPGDTLRMSLVFKPVWDGHAQYAVRAQCTRSDGSAAATLKLRCAPLGDRLRSLPAAPAGVSSPGTGSGIVDVPSLLPHRAPILLVDRVLEHRAGECAVTEYTVREDEPCYRGRASAGTAYPDTLLIESFTQACAALFVLDRRAAGLPTSGTLAFGSARAVRTHAPAFAGQVLRHEVRLDRLVGDTALVSGRTTVDGQERLTAGNLVVLVRTGLTGLTGPS
jgi:3-hydroxymyristoyl/3-hydroxydecanoyl-(acyl carrier protein) dehydratase